MTAVLDQSAHLEEARALVRAELAGSANAANVLAAKEEAWERFLVLGFPKRRDEAWRSLDLSRFRTTPYVLSNAAGAGAIEAMDGLALIPDLGPRAVMVNGRVSGALPAGVAEFAPGFASVDPNPANPFLALNEALAVTGLDLHVPAGQDAGVVHVLHQGLPGDQPLQAHPRIRVCLEAGASLRLIEEYTGAGEAEAWINPVTEITLGDNASLRHVRLQREPEHFRHTATLAVTLDRDARYHGASVVLGGGLTRVDLRTALREPGAEADLLGLYAVRGSQVVDHHTAIDHQQEHTTSRQLYKGIMDDSSRAVFNGHILIREDAQQVIAEQGNENLLLSDSALINTNPQLEIHADDVKCRHGATVGQLDPDKIFYLQSRGIGEERARELLTRAFLMEVAHALEPAEVGQGVERDISERFFSNV